MRQRPEIDGDELEEGKKSRGRIELSVAQVSGSALAAVIAAKLASTLGVYGTILGAGVISVIATCGGPLFQQLFKRTGEQVRDVTAAAKPKARQVPVPAGPQDDRTLMLGTLPAPQPSDEEFGAATTHGTRVRGWKRPAIAAALVFGVTMGGITAYELVAGQDFSGKQGTTTFGSVVRGGGSADHHTPERDQEPTPTPSGSADGTGRQRDGVGTPTTGSTPTPGGGETDTGTPSADPTSSGSAGDGTTPAPTPTGPTTEPTVPTQEPTTGTEQPEAPPAPTTAATEAGTGTGAE
ncbi:hypothetical protein [Streptomyces sp. TLI_105]|uniref:hypothetical protein n=1 Tax=Streptomyces sp. TLI_105 TaxID=1881019 RepID=UPI00089C9F6C|nr:hypothetical protein [Streptomyces sp. TLI_105]SEC27387.1 hypothetical protein SAMN05428939_1968 [Streptomyces sp. TLI_105]